MLVAVRTWRQKVDNDDRKREVEQALLWRALPHQNLVRLLGVVSKGQEPVSIIFPHARETLYDRFAAFSGFFTMQDIGAVMEQLAAALIHMHKHGIIHRDVKPHNMLLHSSCSSPMRVLLCDYGLAMDARDAKTPRMQSQPYRAPEMQLGHLQTPAVDTWSVGCIFRELLTGVLVWERREYKTLSALEYMVLIAAPVRKEELLQMNYPTADADRMTKIQPLSWTACSKRSFDPPPNVLQLGTQVIDSVARRTPVLGLGSSILQALVLCPPTAFREEGPAADTLRGGEEGSAADHRQG